MGLGNGNPKSGDKGSNWRYEYSVLTALEIISQNTGGSSGPSAETPSLTRATGAGLVNIVAGAKSLTFYNSGAADSNVQGVVLKAGEQVSFSATLGNYLAAVTYDPLTSTLVIAKLI
jgi:hypothetical protein